MPSNCAPAETYKQINMEQNFILIGLDDSPSPFFPPEVQELIQDGRYFSGGVRHREIIASLLPDDATWMTINIPLDNVFAQYKAHFETDGHPIVLFLDESTRARPDVLQTLMDLALNRKLAGRSLP